VKLSFELQQFTHDLTPEAESGDPAAAFFSPAQNISLYTIFPVNVSGSLDASHASNACRKRTLNGSQSWLGACSRTYVRQVLEMTKIVIPVKQAATPCRPEKES
jgi:hypothetical protein